jgi:uncharacterized delta-60 repeat protein
MRSTSLFVLLAAVAAVASPERVRAAAGDLDPTFGVDGVARATLRASLGRAGGSAIARQPDGKLVAAGDAGPSETTDLAVVRFDANGVLDTTFNGTGQVTTSVGPFQDYAAQVLIQGDGKIVVVGSTSTAADESTADVALVRYNDDGTLDGDFGTGGIVTTHVNAVNVARAAALQSDGKIVVVGGTGTTTFDALVLRYATDGTLDETFGTDGVVTLDFGGRGDGARDVIVQPDDAIVVAGSSFNGPLFIDGSVGTLTRLDTLGAPDGSFGSGGSVVFTPMPSTIFNALVRQPDGKLVVLAGTGAGGGLGFRLFRFDTAGALDGGFTGAYVPFFITNINADALALAPDGKFVVTGFFASGFQSARANADGSLDATYGNGGWIRDTVGWESVSIGALVEPSSDIVIVGSTQPDLPGPAVPTYELTVARVMGTGSACASDADCGVCERCGGGGTCEIGARSSCAVAAPKKAKLTVVTKGTLAKWSLALSWKGAVPALDPTTTDDVAVCLFQADQRVVKAVAPAGGLCGGVPCWSGTFATKLKYQDKAGTPHGIRTAAITPAKIALKAKGVELAFSPQGLPDASFLGGVAPVPPVVLQVHGSNGACAAATFDSKRKYHSGRFSGTSD